MIELLSLNVGLPRTIRGHGGTMFESSIARTPVSFPVRLTARGFDGDACAYNGHHGANMKVNAFCIENYPFYEERAGRKFDIPAFGENLTLRGYTESDARIGDVLRAGTALVQVTQPRHPCGNIVKLHNLPRVVKWMEEQGHTGFYCKVLEEGTLAPDSQITLIDRGPEQWTIAAINRANFQGEVSEEDANWLLQWNLVAEEWKESFQRRRQKTLR